MEKVINLVVYILWLMFSLICVVGAYTSLNHFSYVNLMTCAIVTTIAAIIYALASEEEEEKIK